MPERGEFRENSFQWEARLSIWVACWNIWLISGTFDKLYFYSTFTIDGPSRVIEENDILPRTRDPHSPMGTKTISMSQHGLIERKNVRRTGVL